VEFKRREGFRVPLSLPPSLQARDSGIFEELKCLFSIAPEARKGGKVMGVFLIEKHLSDATPDTSDG
jgi:hypothetical protein